MNTIADDHPSGKSRRTPTRREFDRRLAANLLVTPNTSCRDEQRNDVVQTAPAFPAILSERKIMLSLKSLQHIASGLRSTLAEMHKVNDAKNQMIERLEADKTKSQNYIAETVKKARDDAIPKLREAFNSMEERHTIAGSQLEYWSSSPLLLSKIAFDLDPAKDAVIRMRYAGELAAMDRPLLALTQRDAITDGNLALAWSCTIAARGTGGGVLNDLSGVEIPEQVEALVAIDECDAAVAEAELILAGMEGQSVDPIRKLELGRRMQPTRQTAHNSEGRGVVW